MVLLNYKQRTQQPDMRAEATSNSKRETADSRQKSNNKQQWDGRLADPSIFQLQNWERCVVASLACAQQTAVILKLLMRFLPPTDILCILSVWIICIGGCDVNVVVGVIHTTVLCCTVLYHHHSNVQNCTVLHCTVLYCGYRHYSIRQELTADLLVNNNSRICDSP